MFFRRNDFMQHMAANPKNIENIPEYKVRIKMFNNKSKLFM